MWGSNLFATQFGVWKLAKSSPKSNRKKLLHFWPKIRPLNALSCQVWACMAQASQATANRQNFFLKIAKFCQILSFFFDFSINFIGIPLLSHINSRTPSTLIWNQNTQSDDALSRWPQPPCKLPVNEYPDKKGKIEYTWRSTPTGMG